MEIMDRVNFTFCYIKCRFFPESMLYYLCCPTDTRQREEVFIMDVAVSFLVTVMGGVVCHYIIKWLDRDDKGDR